jgi:sporulation protein YlmC with PRC-barrel domain
LTVTEITLVIGSDIRCADGLRGEIRCVVVDPGARTVTHLVVEPKGRAGLARLVPLEMVDVTKDEVGLRCTEAEFRDLAPAEETLAEFVPGYDAPVQLLTPGWQDAGGLVAEGGAIPRIPEQESIAIVPPGEVEERRGDHVRATDGEVGQLRALRIDPGNGQVTSVLVRQGHLGTHRYVAIPYETVTEFDDGIQLGITKEQVRNLPPVKVDHPAG